MEIGRFEQPPMDLAPHKGGGSGGSASFNRVADAVLPRDGADAVKAAEAGRAAGVTLQKVVPDPDGNFTVVMRGADGTESTVILGSEQTAAVVGVHTLPAALTSGR